MTEKAIDTCTRCDGSGADPQRKSDIPGIGMVEEVCSTCAGLGETPTAFGREILALLDWLERYREERKALRSYARRR